MYELKRYLIRKQGMHTHTHTHNTHTLHTCTSTRMNVQTAQVEYTWEVQRDSLLLKRVVLSSAFHQDSKAGVETGTVSRERIFSHVPKELRSRLEIEKSVQRT